MIKGPVCFAVLVGASLILAACGGGGGGGGDGGGGGGGGSALQPIVVASPTPPAAAAAELSAARAGNFGGAATRAVAQLRTLNELVRPGVPDEVAVGTRTVSCESGGSVQQRLSNDRLLLIETFDNCVSSISAVSVTLNGIRQIRYSGPARDNAFNADIAFS